MYVLCIKLLVKTNFRNRTVFSIPEIKERASKRKLQADSSFSSPEKKSLSGVSSGSSGTKRKIIKTLHSYR